MLYFLINLLVIIHQVMEDLVLPTFLPSLFSHSQAFPGSPKNDRSRLSLHPRQDLERSYIHFTGQKGTVGMDVKNQGFIA